MIIVDLIYNLALLIALSIVSGFIDGRWNRTTRMGKFLQGFLFGGAAVIGMLRPFVIEAGLIFDGRSVLISLCGLYFGFWPALISCVMTLAVRICQAGSGVYMGILVILSSGTIGVLFHLRRRDSAEMTAVNLFLFGILVHIAMLVMTLALPSAIIWSTFQRIALPVMLTYPLATILIGRILSDQETKSSYVESLQQSEQRFRAIFHSSFHFSFLLNPQGTLLEANQTALDALGVTMPQTVGLPYWEMSWCQGGAEEVLRLKDAVAAAARGRFVRFETEFRSSDQKRILVDFSIKPCMDTAGSVTLLIAEGRDITEWKRADAERQSLQTQLLQSQKLEAIGRLAGGVAHDFNNMLHAILGHVELALQDLPQENPLAKNLREIEKAANHSADLTKQLLAFARKQTIDPKILDLNETVEGILRILERLIREEIELVWIPARHLWPIRMDSTQVHQVLTNLTINARDAIEGVGKIVIETGVAEFDEEFCTVHAGHLPGRFVMLAVSDTGCGMNKEVQAKVFEPFYTTKEMGKGSGLGLATVYGIVRQNHGFINVYSEPGKGSVFRFYIPRCEDTDPAAEGEETIPKASPMIGTETILFVEDEKALLEMGRIFLEKLGYHVLVAGHPDEAIRIGEKYAGPIDLLITDVIMPVMSGCDLMERIVVTRPGIRTLFMSGYTADVIVHRDILREQFHFLQKPFSIGDLADKVREVLQHQKEANS